MVRKLEVLDGPKTNIMADVIILGCSLPGIVAAHKLKKRFGTTMNIVVLDHARPSRVVSKGNVAFQLESEESEEPEYTVTGITNKNLSDNVAKHYLTMYAKEFNIPIPDAILNPENEKLDKLNKLFQYRNGSTVECTNDYNNFDYLSIVERFELNQYQNLLDQSIRDLFQANRVNSESDRRRLRYYDQTTMEKHICDALLFSTSRELMRTTVSLVCGASSHSVSVLFYLHQCYRTNTTRNHLDGNNTRFREKLLGYCRKHLTTKLEQSIADIILMSKPIKKIRSYSDEQVILETMKGGTNYVCNLLAMALRPDELRNIRVEDQLLSEKEATITGAMSPGKVIKFVVQYEDNFWRQVGYSGDILSIKGPIVWAMERPKMSTDSTERYSSLIGYLLVRDGKLNNQDAVLSQLALLFGEKALSPMSYRETNISDIFVPRCGDYVAIRKLTLTQRRGSALEWGALDVFADGDVAAAIEAGHNVYLRLLTSLRPQAQTYEDLSTAYWPTILDEDPFTRWFNRVNYINTMSVVMFTAAIFVGIQLVKSFVRK